MTLLPLLLGWLLTDALATYGVLHHRRAFVPVEPLFSGPRTAVLIAVKGVSRSLPQFLNALRAQRFDSFRLIFALESASDEAFAPLSRFQDELRDRIPVDVIIAGISSQRTQKVHNLLAALGALRVEDRIVVFADADIVPGPTWLSQLVRPVASGETAASCGYRWQLPADQAWPSLIVAAADMSVATAARSRMWNLCWGGSVALDRAALDQLDLNRVWSRAASDDLTLTRALRQRNLRIYVPPFVLVPSPVKHSWTSVLQFIRRQYLLTRIYAPRHWLLAGWTLCVPALGAAITIGLLWQRQWWALSFLLASALLLQLRLLVRHSIARLVLSPPDLEIANSTIRFAGICWPLIHLVHLAGFLSSAFGRRFSWAGRRYRLMGRNTVAR
jgi:ceramide glucosyltransferase